MAREMLELDCAYRVRVEFQNPHEVRYYGPFTRPQARNIRTRILRNTDLNLSGHDYSNAVSATVQVAGDWTDDS